MKTKITWPAFLTLSMVGFFLLGGLRTPKLLATEEATPAKVQEKSVNANSMLDRLGSGFSHIVYGLFEIPYQLKEEMKVTDPVRGFVPGVIKGVGWTVAREAVGIFEVVTFYRPHKELLKEANSDWLYI